MTRVTEGLLYNKADQAMNKSRSNMLGDQEKAITGKRINRPSDDPHGAVRAIGIETKINRNEQALKNMEIANSYLSVADSSLGELSNVLSRAKELAVQMSSSSNQSSDAMSAVKAEVEQLFYQVVQIGNARIGDHYIFGGFQTDKAPFDPDGNFKGDQGIIEIEVQPGQRVPLNVSGLRPFLGLDEMPVPVEVETGAGAEKNLERQGSLKTLRAPATENEENAAASQQPASRGVNLFQVFRGFMEGLDTGNASLINQSLDGIDGAFSQVLESRATVGALQNAVLTNQELVDSQQVTNKELRSDVMDADTTEVYSNLARNETLLTATLEANKKLLTPSLLDFLK
jgi:flagellar hook-associated protein 3 FlgL